MFNTLRLAVFGLVTLVTACSPLNSTKLANFQAEDVVGTWYSVSADADGFSWQLVEIQAGGRKCGLSVSWSEEEGSRRFFHESRWSLQSDQMLMEITASNSYWARVGAKVVDRLVASSPTHFEQVLATPGYTAERERYQRVDQGLYTSVCRLTAKHAKLPGQIDGSAIVDPGRVGYTVPSAVDVPAEVPVDAPVAEEGQPQE